MCWLVNIWDETSLSKSPQQSAPYIFYCAIKLQWMLLFMLCQQIFWTYKIHHKLMSIHKLVWLFMDQYFMPVKENTKYQLKTYNLMSDGILKNIANHQCWQRWLKLLQAVVRVEKDCIRVESSHDDRTSKSRIRHKS